MERAEFLRLLSIQEQLEDNGMKAGARRFRSRLEDSIRKGRLSEAGGARKLLSLNVVKLEEAIQRMIDESKRAKGLKTQAVKWCEMLGADVAAYMTLKVVVDQMLAPKIKRREVVHELTGLIQDELRYRRYRERAKGLFEYTLARFNTTSYTHMARSISATMGKAVCEKCREASKTTCSHLDMSDLTMLPKTREYVGTQLLNLLIETTGLLTYESTARRQGRKIVRDDFLVPTQGALDWLKARNDALEFLWPITMPMVVPPLPWGPHQRGGYRYGLRNKFAIVKAYSQSHVQAVEGREMPIVYEALNRIQETAWRINPHVLALVNEIVKRGGGVAGIPSMQEEAEPRRPPEIEEFNTILKERSARIRAGEEVEAMSDEVAAYEQEWKAWRKDAHAVKERNHIRKIRAKEFQTVYSTVLSVKDHKAIFFPYQLDFRGRVYPISNYLSPQGNDVSKSFLLFADSKPVGDDGASYLAIHGANCLGETPEGVKLSKATLQERVDWITNNTNRIEQVARDPFADLWWCEATVDDPLQFFAFACEWAGYVKLARQGKGAEYQSALPCAMDGTCNGLQHFAAMLRDEIGGKTVNLLPTERPQDVYQHVADYVLGALEAAATESDLARRWLSSGLVTRKLTKRPTMTFGYGSKRFGFKEQLVEFLQKDEQAWPGIRKQFTSEGARKDGDLVQPACLYMSGLVWDALWATTVAAAMAMEWMQKAARGVVRDGKCVSWTVPKTGFFVKQEYMIRTSSQITTVLAGKTARPRVYTDTTDPDPIKQANAIAPNFVHSLDAAALMLTVQAASNEGVDSFGMVHDSYATVAADCPVLAKCTREAFVAFYQQHDVLAELAEQLKTGWKDPAKFPELPPKGGLDLGGILVSSYFFS